MSASPKYFVMTKPESFGCRIEYVGPHPLDKVRLWVHEGILTPDVRIQPAREGYFEYTRAKDLPEFYDFPPGLTEQIEERRRRDEEERKTEPELMTASQADCLKFLSESLGFKGPSLKTGKILTSYQANKIIRQLAEFDPASYQEYLGQEKSGGAHTLSTANVIAAIASFFIPGLGQLVQGRALAALGYFVGSILLWWYIWHLLGFIWIIGFVGHIAACIDARRWAGKR